MHSMLNGHDSHQADRCHEDWRGAGVQYAIAIEQPKVELVPVRKEICKAVSARSGLKLLRFVLWRVRRQPPHAAESSYKRAKAASSAFTLRHTITGYPPAEEIQSSSRS
jgi:hypothetical protein